MIADIILAVTLRVVTRAVVQLGIELEFCQLYFVGIGLKSEREEVEAWNYIISV